MCRQLICRWEWFSSFFPTGDLSEPVIPSVHHLCFHVLSSLSTGLFKMQTLHGFSRMAEWCNSCSCDRKHVDIKSSLRNFRNVRELIVGNSQNKTLGYGSVCRTMDVCICAETPKTGILSVRSLYVPSVSVVMSENLIVRIHLSITVKPLCHLNIWKIRFGQFPSHTWDTVDVRRHLQEMVWFKWGVEPVGGEESPHQHAHSAAVRFHSCSICLTSFQALDTCLLHKISTICWKLLKFEEINWNQSVFRR